MSRWIAWSCAGLLAVMIAPSAFAQSPVEEARERLDGILRHIEVRNGKVVYAGKLQDLLTTAKNLRRIAGKGDDPVLKGSRTLTLPGSAGAVTVTFAVGKNGNVETHPNGFDAVATAPGGIVIAIGGGGSDSDGKTIAGKGGDATASGGVLNIAIAGYGGPGFRGLPGVTGGKATAKCAKGELGVAAGGDGGDGGGGRENGAPGANGGDAEVTGDGDAYGGIGGIGGNAGEGVGGGGGNGGNATIKGTGKAVGGNGGAGGKSKLAGGVVGVDLSPPAGGAGGKATGGKGAQTQAGTAGDPGKVEVR